MRPLQERILFFSCSMFLPSTNVDGRCLHRNRSHDEDWKREHTVLACSMCSCMWGHTLIPGFRITFLMGSGHTRTRAGWESASRPYESATKLNRDAACDLYHSLILLDRPLLLLQEILSNIYHCRVCAAASALVLGNLSFFYLNNSVLALHMSVLSKLWNLDQHKTKKTFHVFIDHPSSETCVDLLYSAPHTASCLIVYTESQTSRPSE